MLRFFEQKKVRKNVRKWKKKKEVPRNQKNWKIGKIEKAHTSTNRTLFGFLLFGKYFECESLKCGIVRSK